MNTKQLPYIIAIAATGSLSEAARQLHLSQPALSKYLAELEQEIGMDLFLRHKKRLYPTPAGKVYLNTAKEILSLQARTRDSIRLLDSPATEELHIGISPHRGAAILAHTFPEFNRSFPYIRLVPHEGYALMLKDLILQGQLDLAVTSHMKGFDDEAHFIPLFREEVILGVPVFHPRVQQDPEPALSAETLEELPFADLKDFKNSSFIMTPVPSALSEVIQPLFGSAAFHPLTAFSSPNIILSESMIRAGAGVGFLPASYQRANRDIAYFRLRQPAYLVSGILCGRHHVLSTAERFLIFLQMQYNAKNPCYQIFCEDPLIQDIIEEFDNTHYLAWGTEEVL